MGKNIEKVKKLIAGVGGKRTPGVGYTPKSIDMRKEGEEWTDSRGRSWKIEEGKRKQMEEEKKRFESEKKILEQNAAEEELQAQNQEIISEE